MIRRVGENVREKGDNKKGGNKPCLTPATHEHVTPLIKELHAIQRVKNASLNKNKIAGKKGKDAKAKQ